MAADPFQNIFEKILKKLYFFSESTVYTMNYLTTFYYSFVWNTLLLWP